MEHKWHEEGRKELKVQNGSKGKNGTGKKNPGSVHVRFVADKVALGQVFPQYFGFPLSISFYRYSITWKNEKTNYLHHRVAQ
jgi:hypothetical protein